MTEASEREDLSSIRDIYVREYQRLRSHLKLALRGNACLAEDLAHEVFLELWRLHGDAIAAMSHNHVRAKLTMTANSRVIDFYRRNR
ncbi:sigma factor, partial [Nocardia pseudovaccinii]|uniref:sigma factor n=1 Tax=Nocardia pseudovaccinii TaxID=189540 RepID=UPI000AEE66DA